MLVCAAGRRRCRGDFLVKFSGEGARVVVDLTEPEVGSAQKLLRRKETSGDYFLNLKFPKIRLARR